jgi:hypothetical protein
LLFDYPTTDALTDHLFATLPSAGEHGPEERAVEPAEHRQDRPIADDVLGDLASLTEEEAEALLLAELDHTETHS